ncbi:carbohydrate sulfotransferase 15-like [Babylonia areolata]|uniref:carbohydrate sulfotransferase 15-like n=1 Tax=Babylonia areolata TaxID=304850 RepID=UPI003FD67591
MSCSRLVWPPIPFIKSLLNPCWYEPQFNLTLSSAREQTQQHDSSNDTATTNTNPYAHNLFTCFSSGARQFFTDIIRMYNDGQKQELEQNREEEEEQQQRLVLPLNQRRRRLRCLPYFYIAGMPKCGSTDLYRRVRLHPDIIIGPPMKEPHWWSKHRFGQRLNFTTWIPLEDYVDLYDKAAQEIQRRQSQDSRDGDDNDDVFLLDDDNEEEEEDDDDDDDDDIGTTGDDTRRRDYHPTVTMDASASTFWNNDEWWRLPENCGRTEPLFTNAHYIHHLTPQARIIVILRNPTDRLFSDYLFFTFGNKSLTAFHEDVLLSIAKLNNCTEQRSLRACVYDKHVAGGKGRTRLRIGLYHTHVSEWLMVFPRDQVLVLRTEDYARDSRHAMRQIFRFLGLRPLTKQEEQTVMKLPKANTRRRDDRKLGSMLPETRQMLNDFYRPHNRQLAEILQDPRFLWEEEEKKDGALTEDKVSETPRHQAEIGRRSTVRGDKASMSKEKVSNQTPDGTAAKRSRTSPLKNVKAEEKRVMYVNDGEVRSHKPTSSTHDSHDNEEKSAEVKISEAEAQTKNKGLHKHIMKDARQRVSDDDVDDNAIHETPEIIADVEQNTEEEDAQDTDDYYDDNYDTDDDGDNQYY